ncbi:hypothetical protein BN12_70009 [Nostocoides japonicum T1-X7]|uniref:Uncharacterized protein n=1 Tax=Nostocoides japonicum T1-X7 TaxID=1194083 RepID=A0A077M0Y1_9MICO|nr:hypothetical protein [Tetrasphaera japonica]CCH79993.1 hypothetical protein BN12_70009 [Tetrasphaera japonica T1-X7]
MTSDTSRLANRTETLLTALRTMDESSYAEVDSVAAVLVTPGFGRNPVAAPVDRALAEHREGRRREMATVLAGLDPAVRAHPVSLALALTDPLDRLVHPMTDEVMCLLDWVLRGGDADQALAVLG